MAYFDENGRITIDENAAATDIRRLRESAQVLKDSRAAIRSLKRQAAEMQGQISSAILDKANEMEKRQTQMIDKLEDTAAYIQRVVDRYQKLDEDIKRAIQAAANAAAAAASAAAVAAGTAGAISSGGGAGGGFSSGGTGGGGGGGGHQISSGKSSSSSKSSSSKKSSKKNEDFGDKIKDAADAIGDFLGGLFD